MSEHPRMIRPLLRRRMFLLGGAATLGGLAYFWNRNRMQVTRNIRVTAKAEVAGKVVEGSAVMGLRWRATDSGRMYVTDNSEAVALELDGRGTVYVLDAFVSECGFANVGIWPYVLMRSLGIPGQGRLEDFPTLRKADGKFKIVPSLGRPPKLPLMVAFKDEAKRETMFEVTPADFPATFGSDVRFLGLWFELSSDAPTDTIPDRLPVMFQVNESYKGFFPKRAASGKLIPGNEKKLPQKIGAPMFFKRGF